MARRLMTPGPPRSRVAASVRGSSAGILEDAPSFALIGLVLVPLLIVPALMIAVEWAAEEAEAAATPTGRQTRGSACSVVRTVATSVVVATAAPPTTPPAAASSKIRLGGGLRS